MGTGHAACIMLPHLPGRCIHGDKWCCFAAPSHESRLRQRVSAVKAAQNFMSLKKKHMAQNHSKNRKSEAQERFDQADNAGRFAGNDPDARAAREQAMEQIRQDTSATSEERNREDEFTDAE